VWNRLAHGYEACQRRIGVVHGFIKKSHKAPPEDLALARKRMQEMQA